MKSEHMFQRSTLRLVLLYALVALLGYAPVCFAGSAEDKTSMEEVKKETADLVETLKAYTAEQREEAVAKTSIALEMLDHRIDALELRVDEHWDEMSKTARKNARASLRALRKQRTDVAERFGSLKTSSIDAWGQMKKGFSDAYRDLSKAWQKAQEEFDSES